MTAKVYEPPTCLMLVKLEWTLNQSCQKLYNQSKPNIKRDACMAFYNALKILYLETDSSGVHLGAGLLQVRYRMVLPAGQSPRWHHTVPFSICKQGCFSTEQGNSNVECEALEIWHGLAKFITASSIEKSSYNGPWTPRHDIQEGYGNTITKGTVHPTQNTLVQGIYHI